MEKLRGHGVRDSSGLLQVKHTIIECLISSEWIITVEVANDTELGDGYWMELMTNGRPPPSTMLDISPGDVIDGMFVKTWVEVMMFLAMNLEYFRDRQIYSTANASAPKPPPVTQEQQDVHDMDAAWKRCNCEISSGDWKLHGGMGMCEGADCEYYLEGARIANRKAKVSNMRLKHARF